MPLTRNVYDTYELLGVFQELTPVPEFWRRWFPGSYFSESETIEFSKIEGVRKLAPFVLPTIPGEPVYRPAERLEEVKPAYIKMKDPVSATGLIRRAAGFGELGQAQAMSPQQRYDALVAAKVQQQREALERRLEWMCAQVLQMGSITIADQRYPSVTVNYNRSAGLSVTLAAAARWSVAATDIVMQINGWIELMSVAKFGGPPTDMICGPKAYEAFRKNASVLKLLDTQIRGTAANFDIGIGNGQPYQYKGTLSGDLNIWTYSDYYEEITAAGDIESKKFLDERDILLLAPPAGVDGIMAYGAIQDLGAELQSIPVHLKMWNEEDPSATMILTQSAPLPILVNPNRTFRARVIA